MLALEGAIVYDPPMPTPLLNVAIDHVEMIVPDREAANYMYYRGGVLRFGKLTMHDADLFIVDASPEDPFDFFLQRYVRQLVAGTSRTTPDLGLIVVMPDYRKLPPVSKGRKGGKDEKDGR